MGYPEDVPELRIRKRTNADLARLTRLAGLNATPIDVKRSCYVLLDMMMCAREFLDEEPAALDLWVVATEHMLLWFAHVGLLCMKSVGSYKVEFRDAMLNAVMAGVEEKQEAVLGALKARLVSPVRVYVGRQSPTFLSPIHLIAQSVREEYGISFQEFETCLHLSGEITSYHLEGGDSGFLEQTANWFLEWFAGLKR